MKKNIVNYKYNKLISDSLEPDSKVLKLTKVLSSMNEVLNSFLHPRKTKVIHYSNTSKEHHFTKSQLTTNLND